MKKIVLWLIWISCIGFADIYLQRYSINTYTNKGTGGVEENPVNLKVDEEAHSSLVALRVAYRQFANPTLNSSSLLSIENRLTLSDSISANIFEPALVYPNPMRLNDSAIFGYWLSEAANIEIQIYDLFGHKIFTQDLISGMTGARMGYNILTINSTTFDYFDMAAGVYFIYITDANNDVIGKAKFAVVP